MSDRYSTESRLSMMVTDEEQLQTVLLMIDAMRSWRDIVAEAAFRFLE